MRHSQLEEAALEGAAAMVKEAKRVAKRAKKRARKAAELSEALLDITTLPVVICTLGQKS